MDKQYAEQVLKEFVERDRMLRENSVKSDYDKFCETTCRAIETILAENKELKSKYDRALSDLVKAEKEKNELKEENEKNMKFINEIQSQKADILMYRNVILVSSVKEKIEKISNDLETMKVDGMYGRFKEYGGKLSFDKRFSYKYGMHDVLQELLEKRK